MTSKGPWRDKTFDPTNWKPPTPLSSLVHGDGMSRTVWWIAIGWTLLCAVVGLTVFAWGAEAPPPRDPDNLWCQYFVKEVIPESFPWAAQFPDAYGPDTEVYRMYLWAENMLCGKGGTAS